MDHTLHARFLRGLAAAENAPAVVVGERSLTYAELHEHALARAGALLADAAGAAAGGGERPRAVGVLANKSVEAYAGVLAALYAGATVVPLHPDFPVARNRAALDASGATAVLADLAGAKSLDQLLEGRDDVTALVPERDGVPGRPLDEPCHDAGPADTAYLLFTSGSTGWPKGVRISHGNTDHYFRLVADRYGFTPDDRLSQTFDLTFDCAAFDLFAAWGAGACVVATDTRAYFALPAFAERHRLTVWFSTPSAISFLRKAGGLGPGALPGLRWSLFAGEALKVADAEDWLRAAPGAVLENIYGPTELTITIAGHRFDPERSPGLAANGIVPIGAVHPGHQQLLLDPEGRPVAAERGAEGELCVAGPQVTPGYLDPADGAGRFHEHQGLRYYRTGDRVRQLPDAELAYLGRADSQVQVQGVRVELAEIDHALLACDGVEDAVTVAAGTGELVVFYTGTAASPRDLVGRLRETLPEAVVPRRYQHLDQLPLNANRKVDRAALTARAGALVGER